MKIGIIGNCQAAVIARWLERMLPGHDICHHGLHLPPDRFEAVEESLAGCDLILSQIVGPGAGPLETAKLRRQGPRLAMIPALTFTGFHPDMAYVYRKDGSFVPSPVGAYHSRIIAACFHIGLGPIRTETLFNSFVYDRLGFFADYAKASLDLEEILTAGGFAVSMDDLMARGVFMHTMNHPTAFALRVLTSDALRKAGIDAEQDIADIVDPLADSTIWPVYPAIARRAGIGEGSMTYLRGLHLCADGESREMALGQLIRESFDIYASEGDRVDFKPVAEDAERLRLALQKKYGD